MGNFGRRPITDASKGQPQVTYMFDGEERIDRRPQGKVERFVDPDGNVVSLQLAGDGDPHRAATLDKSRLHFRRKGFVEHAKCPIRNATMGNCPKDLDAMPADLKLKPCSHDPRTLTKVGHDFHAQKACVHVEWLIAHRVAWAAKQAEKRNAAQVAAEKRKRESDELQAAQLEMVKEQIAERKARKSKKDTSE